MTLGFVLADHIVALPHDMLRILDNALHICVGRIATAKNMAEATQNITNESSSIMNILWSLGLIPPAADRPNVHTPP